MISSAKEFIRLRTSEDKDDDDRAAKEESSLSVWWKLVQNHPEMKSWVAHNKTVPLEVLDVGAGVVGELLQAARTAARRRLIGAI